MLPRTTMPSGGGKVLDKIRATTDPDINHRIDEKAERDLRYFSVQSEDVITSRLEDLDREWDVDRVIECNASCIALTGLVLGMFHRKWLLLSAAAMGVLGMHVSKGLCPPTTALRRLGLRSRQEIDAEKFALKFARGDFEEVQGVLDKTAKAVAAFKACCK